MSAGWGRVARVSGAGVVALVVTAALGRAQLADPCVRCDVLYVSTYSPSAVWEVDPRTGAVSFVAATSREWHDIAVTADGRIIGVPGGLTEFSACDGTERLLPPYSLFFPVGLTGDLTTTDVLSAGPPLERFESHGGTAKQVIGGVRGPAPGWCQVLAGDIALSPNDGLLRATMNCACTPGGSRLARLDPLTGDALPEYGCIADAGGTGYPELWGLAYSGSQLYGMSSWYRNLLLRIDENTGLTETIPLSQGLNLTGMASVPCGVPVPGPCARLAPDPLPVGGFLRVIQHGDPLAAEITARLTWWAGAGWPPELHFHVRRGTDPRSLTVLTEPEPLRATTWVDSTPAAPSPRRPFIHFYDIRTADDCERESR